MTYDEIFTFPPGYLRAVSNQLPPVPAAEAPDDTEQVERLIHDAFFPLILIERLTEFPVLFPDDAYALIYPIREVRVLYLRGLHAVGQLHQ